MNVWNIDAGDISDEKSFDEDLLYRTNQIDDFLSTKRDNLFFVTATKGLGKTFVLKAKSIKYTRDGIPLIHANLLVDKPGTGSVIFDKEKLNLFSNCQNWTNLWTMAISIAALKRLKMTEGTKSYSELLERLYGFPADTITDYFKIILGLSIRDFFEVINLLNNIVSPLVSSIRTPMVAFIDNVDEYFESHIEKSEFSKSSTEGQTSKQIWYLSQIGLIESIYQITSRNPHIKIFASIRKEVFIKLPDHDSKSLQYSGCSIELNYSVEDLHEIFILNIKNEISSRLSFPQALASDPIYAFCGVHNVAHNYVNGEIENIFDYIHRHTLQRPRDFMKIGRAISQTKIADRSILNLQKIINDSSTEIAQSYLQEVSPHLGAINFKLLFQYIDSNIITVSELKKICGQYNNTECYDPTCSNCTGLHVFCAMYSVGLLGCVRRNIVTRETVQDFLPPGMKTFDIAGNLPVSEHYLVHPCLYGLIQKENKKFKPDKTCIVGPGRNLNSFDKWNKPSKSKKHIGNTKKLLDLPRSTNYCHLHFGAGRLGLGLVVPLINKYGCKIVVVQRPSDKWKQLKNSETIKLSVNSNEVLSFDVIHESSKKRGMDYISEKWVSTNNLMLITSDTNLIKLFVKNSHSISTAIGTEIRDIIEYFVDNNINNDVNLYPFENDKNLVELFADKLRKVNRNVNIVPVVADKICSEVKLNKNIVNVLSDDFEEVVLHGVNKNVGKLFSGCSTVRITKTLHEHDFYSYKKYYIVNGLHMILAIYGYNYLLSKSIPFKNWKHYHLNIIFNTNNLKEKMSLFVKIQSIRLILETEEKTLNTIYSNSNLNTIYADIISYGDITLDRFDKSVDLISRVLEIENIDDIEKLEGKFKERIEKLINFINNKKESIKSLNIDKIPTVEEMLTLSVELQNNISRLFMEIIKQKHEIIKQNQVQQSHQGRRRETRRR